MSNIPADPRLVARFQSLTRAVAIAIVTAGSLNVLGWVFDIAIFKSLLTSLAPLRFNIGLCFVLIGLALYHIRTRPRWGLLLAGIVLVIALLTLSQHAFGWDLGIDQLLMRDATPSTNPTARPGRMSVITTILFSLMSGAIILYGWRRYLFGQVVTLLALLVSLLALLGYLYDVSSLYSIAQSSSIALHTAVTFSVLGFGVLLAFSDQGLMWLISANSAGGYSLRYALPAVALVPLIIGWLEWQGELVELYTHGFGLAMFTLAHVILLSVITVWIAGKVHNADMERQQALDAQRKIYVELEDRSRDLISVNSSLAQEVIQRKQAEEAVNKLNAELEQRVHERTVHLTAIIKELDAFNYSVSHDLRSPLRAMDGYAQALLEDQQDVLDDRAKHYLTRIRSASQRMGTVIDDLLQLAQLSRAEMVPSEVDLHHLAIDAIAELKEENPDRQLEVSIETPLTTTGDARLLRVALQNLLNNAWKFTRKQSHPMITLGSIERDGKRIYFVRDNGVGFDMRYANKLFRAFQRLHDVQDFEGTGIGLAIVARIIQRHGGEIWAESKIGEGATFYFTL